MIRIIKSKRYNTETAEEVASDSYGYASDFRHYSEVLYRTPKGAWFLHGVGGPMTCYAVSLGNNSTGGGEKIIPYTDDEARAWLERNDEVEALEQHFADNIEDA